MLLLFFFHHKIYLNGNQLLLDEEYIENIKTILKDLDINFYFKTIREIFKDLIPEDSIFLINDKEFSKDEEKEESIIDIIEKHGIINIFVPKLYKKIEYEKKILNFNDLKIIEKFNNFNVIEYPEIKKNYGNKENNLEFINGFLNFLFDINIDDKYRLKLENSNNDNDNDNENENIILEKYINSDKGNFKIICFNIKDKVYLDLKYIEKLEQILESLENQLFIDLIICNNTLNPICSIEKLKEKIFFCSPNYSFDIYKFNFLDTEINIKEKLKAIISNEYNDKDKNDETDKEKIVKDMFLNIFQLEEK